MSSIDEEWVDRIGSTGYWSGEEFIQSPHAPFSSFAGQMAVAVAGCSKPVEEIVPYVKMPERVVPGELLRFATTLPLSGYGRGVLAISTDGRPIKIEGNPRHPASLGATDVFAEAACLVALRSGSIANLNAQRRHFIMGHVPRGAAAGNAASDTHRTAKD